MYYTVRKPSYPGDMRPVLLISSCYIVFYHIFIESFMFNTHFGLKTDFKGGAVLIVPFDTKWRSSIYSFQKQVEQFYLFRSTFDGAVLSVPAHIKWSSSICSGAHSMAQFYLFRSRLGGAVLFVPTHIRWCSSICSGAY